MQSTKICMEIVYLFDTANVESNKCMTMNMSSFELGRLPLIIANRRSYESEEDLTLVKIVSHYYRFNFLVRTLKR